MKVYGSGWVWGGWLVVGLLEKKWEMVVWRLGEWMGLLR